MSLNGLDDPKVQEAHEAAVAEPGGWFLLNAQQCRWIRRDESSLRFLEISKKERGN
ncbi:uncharacterized protein LW94_1723 [Fusarium fujikuroi]|nr:uncharacterized protein LW94_1723 [Fusarium fujikuroi]